MTTPASTYRIQFNKDFTFNYLGSILDYLHELGITTIYASPIQQPTAGSTHGYDGIDPSKINNELGTIDDLAALSGALQEKNMTWIQDIVPNHLAFNTTNVWLRDVLERGINSSYASYFDIDWDHPFYKGKLMTPFLEAPLTDCITDGKIKLVFTDQGFSLAYYDSHYPLNPESYPFVLSGVFEDESNNVNAAVNGLINTNNISYDHWQEMKTALINLLSEPDIKQRIEEKIEIINADNHLIYTLAHSQHYALCHHTDSHTVVNYRRFFNVNGLICLRIEEQHVFDDYHRITHQLYEKGYIHGLRIDHIDGLKNPREYIDRLRALFGKDCYIVVEKILDPKEQLPSHFDIQGTSGYEFLSYINQVITDNKGSEKLLALYHKYVPEHDDYEGMVYRNKFSNLDSYLNGEWDNLLRLLLSLNIIDDEEIRMQSLKTALGALMSAFPVYRLYVDSFPLDANDKLLIDIAFEKANERHPELEYELKVLEELFHPSEDTLRTSNRMLFIQRLMQFTGPLMAKGLEDTTFYLYNPLISHNEVGDQPCVLGIDTRTFHEKMTERQYKNPLSFNCTSTHDTKRGEDGRVRINIISELADEWGELVAHWQRINEPYRVQLGDVRAPIVNDEYFLYQAIVGGFPEDLELDEEFVTRTQTYFTKVLRESKQMSDYVTPNLPYEEASRKFIAHLLNPSHSFYPSITPFIKKIIRYANTYTMVQVIIKIAAPGIPDIYRGCELWDISYVDPDNRRPVDFELRRSILKELKQRRLDGIDNMLEWAEQNYEVGAQKMFITHTMLQLRKQYNDIFIKGDYIPVYSGAGDREVIAFARHLGEQWILIVLPLGIVANTGKELSLPLPENAPVRWRNIFTDEEVLGNTIDVHQLYRKFPVAVLTSGLAK